MKILKVVLYSSRIRDRIQVRRFSVDALVEAVPELAEVANIEAIQVCNVNSDYITSEIWIELANMINEMAKNDNTLLRRMLSCVKTRLPQTTSPHRKLSFF